MATVLKLVLVALVFPSALLAAQSSDLAPQKLTHLRFFLHEFNNPPNQTAVQVAQASTTAQSPSSFGAIAVVDDLLTEGPDVGSKPVGRFQGMTVITDPSLFAMLVAVNFVITKGKYNGSTLTMLGRNRLSLAEREMPIVGGTGLFRFARGYVKTSTVSMDQTTGITVAEYNLYVLHS